MDTKQKKHGKDLWLGFKARRILALGLRAPEATSLGRATAFNRHTVGEFYDNLGKVIDQYHFGPQDIYNVDETGCATAHNPKDIVTGIEKKQVGSMTSAERGELVTIVYMIGASGAVLPPMFIFSRVWRLLTVTKVYQLTLSSVSTNPTGGGQLIQFDHLPKILCYDFICSANHIIWCRKIVKCLLYCVVLLLF